MEVINTLGKLSRKLFWTGYPSLFEFCLRELGYEEASRLPKNARAMRDP